MKSLTEVLDNFKSVTFDNRDAYRLMLFCPEDQLHKLDLELNDEYKGRHEAIEFTEENILRQLREDVEFGFEKALGQRALSADMMYAVVCMWLDVLEDDEIDREQYNMYGLPLFKAVAVKYGFDNPIGDDDGSEAPV